MDKDFVDKVSDQLGNSSHTKITQIRFMDKFSKLRQIYKMIDSEYVDEIS